MSCSRLVEMASATTRMTLVICCSAVIAAFLTVTSSVLFIKFPPNINFGAPVDRDVRAPLTWAPLRFTQDGTFQITIFEDLHFGEAEDLDWGPIQDVRSEKVMHDILSFESPQLVVLNGDLITGENTFLENSSHYLDAIVRPIVQRGLPFASAYGNHDSDFNLSSRALFAREKRYQNSLTKSMVDGRSVGVTNYFLPVYDNDKGLQNPTLLLWFFDSQAGHYFQELDEEGKMVGRQSWVDDKVVDWFRDMNARLTDHGRINIPSLAFVHIPTNAMTAFQSGGIDGHKEPGINDDFPVDQQGLIGGEDDNGSPVNRYSGNDIPFMSALLETPGMMALFSGHDHGNDWCFKWSSKLPGMNLTGNGLNMCFGRHTGYGGYGDWTRGSRQILLDKKTLGKATETWIRLEDGNVSGRVTLNSTYGKDSYPVVKS